MNTRLAYPVTSSTYAPLLDLPECLMGSGFFSTENINTMSRDKCERVMFSDAESLALEAIADELGLSKSSLMRSIFLKYLADYRERKALQKAGLLDRSEVG